MAFLGYLAIDCYDRWNDRTIGSSDFRFYLNDSGRRDQRNCGRVGNWDTFDPVWCFTCDQRIILTNSSSSLLMR